MGYGRNYLRIARMVAVALVLTAVGAVGQSHIPALAVPGGRRAGAVPAGSPQITALSQPTTSSIAVSWLAADNTDMHWIYAVKSDGTGGRFQPAIPDPPPSQGASGQSGPVIGVSHVTMVTGLAAGTEYWFAILGSRTPSDSNSSPSEWFRWSNWGKATTLTVPTVSLGTDMTVAEGGTATLTVTVTNVNEAPTFTSSATFNLAKNSTAVGTVTATDPDAADSVTGYTLSGTDADLFEITTAGALAFSAAPDFEAPQGGVDDDSNTYELTITATGGTGARALTTTQDLTVTVTDVNENPPPPPRHPRRLRRRPIRARRGISAPKLPGRQSTCRGPRRSVTAASRSHTIRGSGATTTADFGPPAAARPARPTPSMGPLAAPTKSAWPRTTPGAGGGDTSLRARNQQRHSERQTYGGIRGGCADTPRSTLT